MAPVRVDALHFSPDTRVFLRLLHAHGVKYHNLLNAIDGVGFPEAWERRETAILGLPDGEVPLPYIGLDGLIRNKVAAGRPKDLEDLQYLRASREARAR